MKLHKLYIVLILIVFTINILTGFVFGAEYNNIILNVTNTINDIDKESSIDEDKAIDKKQTIDNSISINENKSAENEVLTNKEEIKENINENNIVKNDMDNQIMLFSNTPSLEVQYKTHVQKDGWQEYVKDGKTAGTEGRGLRLEGINIQLLNAEKNLNIKYQVHIQDIGWQEWKKNGEMAGTSGKSLRLEAIKINLESSDEYSISYRVHIQDLGWQEWKTDGEMAGTSGKSLRLEAIQIKIIPKKKKGTLCIDTPSNGNTYYSTSSIDVQGWKMANISNTTIKAYIDNNEISPNKINYYNRPDVTNAILDYGTATQNSKAGFRLNLDVTNLSNGNHTIKIVLYSETTVLNTISTTFKLDKNLHVTYRSHVQAIGWQGYVKDGTISGTSGKSYRVEALNINLINAPQNAKILYRTHVQDVGWQEWKSNGEMAGTSGRSLRIEAIEIKLQNMDNYTVEYQVHVQDKGWTDWYIDGETAGTIGQSKRIEAIKIRFVPKYKREYNGIDVSQYNGIINWAQVKREGIDFAFIRVGFRGYGQAGNFKEDSNFKLNIEAATKIGIPVGVYFVTQAITENEAIEEANWVIDKVKEYDIKYPIAIDIESPGLENPNDIPRTQNLDKDTRTYLAKVFCKTIQNSGYTPIIYTNVNWAINKLNMSELAQYDTWIASYRNGNPGYNGKYSIWQYTSSGTINGILGNVDLNISYKKY